MGTYDGFANLGTYNLITGKTKSLGSCDFGYRLVHVRPDRIYAIRYGMNQGPAVVEIRGEHEKVIYRNKQLTTNLDVSQVYLGNSHVPAFLIVDQGHEVTKAIIKVHGGPRLQEKPYWSAKHELLTQRGQAILAINYRGSSGYGRSFEKLGSIQSQIRDLQSAISYLSINHDLSSRDIAIWSESYAANLFWS